MSELRSHVSRGGVVADGSGHELCEILGTPMGTNTIVTASPAPRRREPLRLRLLALYEPSWIDLCPLSLLFNRLHATLPCKVTRLSHLWFQLLQPYSVCAGYCCRRGLEWCANAVLHICTHDAAPGGVVLSWSLSAAGTTQSASTPLVVALVCSSARALLVDTLWRFL